MRAAYDSRIVQQRGLALITTLLVVAVVSTVAAYLSLGQQVWLRQAQNLSDIAQLKAIERGALDGGVVKLMLEARQNQVDHLREEWAKPWGLDPQTIGGALVVGRASDAQARFNINNLLREGRPSVGDIATFKRLLQAQQLDPNLAEAVLDWMDADGDARPGGAEDSEYLALPMAYRAGNRLFQTVGELRLVRGFDALVVEKLRPWLVALPTTTEININTAAPEVIAALFPNLSVTVVTALIGNRPFNDTQAFLGQIPEDAGQPQAAIGVKTAYFEATLVTELGRSRRQTRALIFRPAAPATAKVVWHGL
jgi:general secretion pathway protein K